MAAIIKEVEDSIMCPLCMDIFNSPRALPCLHAFCDGCLARYIQINTTAGKTTCPVCCVDTVVPVTGVRTYPAAFLQASLAETFKRNQVTVVGQFFD